MNYTTLSALGAGLVYSANKGEWTVGQFYRVNDLVGWEELAYRSKAEHISDSAKEPGHAPRYWDIIVA